jgi:hypothetical protein
MSITDACHHHKRKRRSQCHKETEQGQRAKALEKVEAWDKAAGAAALVETVSARTVVKECPTSRAIPALRKHAPSAGRP